VTVDATTNRIQPTGVSYDFNGNMNTNTLALAYDVANRVQSAGAWGVNGQFYGYDPDNRRMYACQTTFFQACTAQTIYFYGRTARSWQPTRWARFRRTVRRFR
jgi:hypothetical protein